MGDALFDSVARYQGDRPWGRFLDAGTGNHSLRWICGLGTAGWTAVTGTPARARNLGRDLAPEMRPQDELIVGNWQDEAMLHGQVFDTVLADYLLGALDGFAPFYQDQLFGRLRRHVGGRLYLIGLEPFDETDRSDEARLVRAIQRLRDACILLAGHRCYREYPREWVIRNLERSGFEVEDSWPKPVKFGRRFVDGQLDVAARKLPHFSDPALAAAMRGRIETLREMGRALADRPEGIQFGEDYVVVARPV